MSKPRRVERIEYECDGCRHVDGCDAQFTGRWYNQDPLVMLAAIGWRVEFQEGVEDPVTLCPDCVAHPAAKVFAG